MHFYILTLFPDMIRQIMHTSIIGRAVSHGILTFEAVNIRDYTADKHKKVDDYPYGGGAGMVMQAQPVYDAWKAVMDRIGQETKIMGMITSLYGAGRCWNHLLQPKKRKAGKRTR